MVALLSSSRFVGVQLMERHSEVQGVAEAACAEGDARAPVPDARRSGGPVGRVARDDQPNRTGLHGASVQHDPKAGASAQGRASGVGRDRDSGGRRLMATGEVVVEPKRKAKKRADGEGSIFKRSDGLWVGRLMVGTKLDGK